jgi:predicted nucleotidyltransferase
MMLENTGLSRDDVTSVQQTLRRFQESAKLILYGSRAKGNYRPGSDIDLTLIGSELSHQDLLDIELALDDLPLPHKFDLSLHHQVDNPQLIDHINRVGKLFYKAAS